MEILRLSPLTISASIAYAGGSKHIWIAMILCFCTSLCHFDFFTKYAMSILQSGVLAKESLKNSYQLGIIASACFSRGLFNVFKSSSALEKNKTILISALIILAAFVITLFVPSSDIKDSRDWSETVAFLVAAWILERALPLVGTLPRHGMLIHFYNIITRVFIVHAADTVSCRTYNAFLLIEWYCCLRCFRHVLVFRTDICTYMSSSCLRCCSTLFDSRRLRDVVSLFSSCGYDTLSFNVR